MQHSSGGGEVRLVVGREEGFAELRVEDDGSGIAKEALPFVFDRFYREDRSRSRETGGSGLGLAICKAIVMRSCGEIAMESEVGVGTKVRVRLPLNADAESGDFSAAPREKTARLGLE